MIKLFSVKIGQQPKSDWYTKKPVQRILTNQIDNGVNLVKKHKNEYHAFYLTIEDAHPVRRFFTKLLKKDDSNIPVRMNAEFSRAKNPCVPIGVRHSFNDTFPMKQIYDLKNGKDLLKDENSFVSKLVKNINETLKKDI